MRALQFHFSGNIQRNGMLIMIMVRMKKTITTIIIIIIIIIIAFKGAI